MLACARFADYLCNSLHKPWWHPPPRLNPLRKATARLRYRVDSRPQICHSLSTSTSPLTRGVLQVDPRVQHALEEGRPVVALESTIISHGMPYPQNLAMARGVEDIVRSRGATPATVAILSGRPHVGLAPEELRSLAESGPSARKCSRRDLAVAMAQGADGATTVAATAYLASLAGIRVFVTGGMGGVHRGAETTFDVSADLAELAHTPVIVVCAGVKSILDIEKTLEVLETNGVPVVSFGTNEFPAFFSPSSGVPSPLRLDTPSEVASAAKAGFDLGMRNGMIVAVPNPSPMAHGADVDAAIRAALGDAAEQGLKGRDITPFVLTRVNQTTAGQSLKSNIALVRHNAEVGADIAVELAKLSGGCATTSSPPDVAVPLRGGEGDRHQPLPDTSSHRRPRAAVFGGAVADIISKPEAREPLVLGTSTPGETRRSFGGVGRNIAEGLARIFSPRIPDGFGDDGGGRAEVTLVSAVGADDLGSALVAGCEEAGVRARATVVTPPPRDHKGGTGTPQTASYVAMLDGHGDLVAAVADMRVMESMTSDFVEKHAGVFDDASVLIADGNLPPDGFARVAAMSAQAGVPLVFEPTSVAKCSVPFAAKAAGRVALATPNLDELEAMFAAARAHEGGDESEKSVTGAGSASNGQSLAQAALVDGRLASARSLGPALEGVLWTMLRADASGGTTSLEGAPLLDGGRHLAVTMGSAGVLLASARPLHTRNTGVADAASDHRPHVFVEEPPDSGRLFVLSAEHYPALPLGGEGYERTANCTGAGDCLVAGVVAGTMLGWSMHESMCLGLVSARESVVDDLTVPRSLSDILVAGQSLVPARVRGNVDPEPVLRRLLPRNYRSTTIDPWVR